MTPKDDIDYTTLTWVKGELDETLKQARQSLEAYVEDFSDASQIRFCATYLHQVQGTLRIVELYAAAMLAEEMEHLATALLEGSVSDRDEACAVLMRGIMQLPDYLERLQSGHKDVPIVLLPLLNDLRAARGEKGLSEIVLFTPDLSRELPATASGPAQALPEAELRQRAEVLRSQFQLALLKWFRNDDVDANLHRLTEACDQLIAVTAEIEARRLFWVTGGVLEALRAKAFEPSKDLKQSVGKVEREIKRLADAGEKSFRADPPHELTRNLLYFVAHAPTDHGRIGELRDVFRLGSMLPSQEEVEHARGSIAGHNRSLLDTVAGAIKEDLLRVKDALDLHMRNPSAVSEQLSGQAEVLERVGDTLGMLGLSVARRVVLEQRDAIRSVVDSSKPASEVSLLDIAGALLYVEASLDEQVQHLGGAQESIGAGAGSVVPANETRRVMKALMKEAQVNFDRAKQCFVAYIESNWDANQLKDAPDQLDEVAGALHIIDLPEVADYVVGVALFTSRELLKHRRVPDVSQMEAMADALASLEYFLEAQGEQRPGRERILNTARSALEKLGYWPLPANEVVPEALEAQAARVETADFDATAALVEATEVRTSIVEEPVAVMAAANATRIDIPTDAAVESVAAAAEAFVDVPQVEITSIAQPETPAEVEVTVQAPEAVKSPVPHAPVTVVELAREEGPIVGGFEAASEEIDEEIREVFVEEVEEEINNLGELLPTWVEAPNDLDRLKSIRRVFHTLKGSGRLVGALTLGEFSWKVENMLNRVLDHTIQPTHSVVVLVSSAHEVLPELLAALRGERSVRTDLELMKSVAERLAAGEQVLYEPPVPEATLAEVVPEAEDVSSDALASEPEIAAVTTETVEEPAEPMQDVDAVAELPEAIGETIEAATEDVLPIDDGRVAVAAIDSVLFDILKPEVSGHLDTVDAYLAAGDRPVTDVLVRAVHTMNGAFAMTEVPMVTELTSPLENYLKRVLAHGGLPSEEGRMVVAAASRALRNAVHELDSDQPRLTPLSDLAAQVVAIRDQLPEALGPTVPTHPLSDSAEVPALSSVVMLEVPSAQAIDQIAQGIEPETVATKAAPVDTIEPASAPFDAAALAALGEAEVTLSGVGMEGLVEEASSILATIETPIEEAQIETTQIEEAQIEEVQIEEVQIEEVQTEEVQIEEIQIEETEIEETEIEETEIEETEIEETEIEEIQIEEASFEGDAETVSELAETLDLPVADLVEPQSAERLEIQELGVVEHDLVIDEQVDGVEEVDFDLAGVESQSSAGDDVDALIRDWLAQEAEVAALVTPVSEVDEAAVVQATEEPARAETDSEVIDDADALSFPEDLIDAEFVAPIETMAESSGTVSADTFFESLSDENDDANAPEVAAATESSVAAEFVGDFEVPVVSESEHVPRAEISEQLDSDLASEDEPEAAVEEDASVDQTPLGAGAGADEVQFDGESEAVLADEASAEPDADTVETTALESDDADELEVAAATALESDDVDEFEVVAEAAPESAVPSLSPAEAARQAMLSAWFTGGLEASDPDPDGALVLPDMDEELLDIFVEEATDILDHSDGLMSSLRERGGEHETVVALQRDLHTLKGGARMAGVFAIGDLGHVMESLLEIVADGKRALPRYGIDVLEVAFDRLNRMTTRVAARQALAVPSTLVQRVEMLARGEEPELELLDQPLLEAGVESATEVVATPDGAQVISRPAEPFNIPEATPTALDEEDTGVRTTHEQIRIRADLLDRLVNYAGEVAIYRARLEQQLGLFRSNLTELEQTVDRLRGQLRKLEIETEAQIVARYQREAEMSGEETFDPLELDRFSTLQQLSRALSESAADLVSLQGTLEDHTRQYETLLLQQSRVSSDLQEGLMRTRMVPFDSLVPRMRRIIRQTAGELGKKAQLRVEGAQGEMDRSVLDRMTAPLEHMLRNALAHGLETPDDRRAAAKPEEGTIRIAFAREGSEVVIRVSDDGRGLDREAIRRKAIDRGLLATGATVTDQTLYSFILESGFSTATTVSRIAGRGVGMDVVHSEIRQLGGSLSIDSERGRGTVFTVRLPFTLAVTQAVFVQQGETSYAVPIASVQGVSRIDRVDLDAQLASSDPKFTYAGEDYAIHDLGRLLGQPVTRAEGSIQVPVLLARSGDLRVAICVDNVIGSREIVVKTVGAQVSSIPGIFGATIMGDGRVIVILDVAPLARRYAALHAEGMQAVDAVVEEARPVPLVMVVDDSITMRKVTGRVLERHGYEVLTAKDGVDAIEKLVDRVPDVMLLDIEMPRMDGYELATHIRNDVRLRRIPIIMITSRTGEKHRQRAFEIGVDRYLGKPYQETDLMRNVDEILEARRGYRG